MTNRVLAVAVLTLLAGGCDEKLSDVAGPTPNLTPTFSSIQNDIFDAPDSTGRASCTSCHTNAGGRTPASGLNLAGTGAYAALVNRASVAKTGAVLVIPGDPENSYIIHKIEGRSGIVGMRMPRTGGPYLTDGQIRIIKRWIEEGAQNN
jgi:hypothetical protein